MDATASRELAKAIASLRIACERRVPIGIHIHGHTDETARQAFEAIIRYARRLGFAIASGHGGRPGVDPPRSPLVDALALLIETRPQQRPLLIGIDRFDQRDDFTISGLRFLSERLGQEPVAMVVLDGGFAHVVSGQLRIESGPAHAVFRRILASSLAPLPSVGACPALTPAELRVARLVCAGSTNAAVARALGVSNSTVGTHLRAVFQKLQVRSRVQLVHAMQAAS